MTLPAAHGNRPALSGGLKVKVLFLVLRWFALLIGQHLRGRRSSNPQPSQPFRLLGGSKGFGTSQSAHRNSLKVKCTTQRTRINRSHKAPEEPAIARPEPGLILRVSSGLEFRHMLGGQEERGRLGCKVTGQRLLNLQEVGL